MLFSDGQMREVLVRIPARGGSKGLPRKALQDLGGKPLIAWTIEHALSVQCADLVMVNTDDPEIADVSRAYGAQVPFLRPRYLGKGTTLLEKVFLHQYRWFYYARKGTSYDISITMSPTCPFRRKGLINNSFSISFHYRTGEGCHSIAYPINDVESIDVDYLSDLAKSRMVIRHGITWQ